MPTIACIQTSPEFKGIKTRTSRSPMLSFEVCNAGGAGRVLWAIAHDGGAANSFKFSEIATVLASSLARLAASWVVKR